MSQMQQEFRGDGTTAKQMKDAKEGAFYIWVNAHTGYPRRLAKELGRDDLRIFTKEILKHPEEMYGLRAPEIILDHAITLTRQEQEFLHMMTVSVVRP